MSMMKPKHRKEEQPTKGSLVSYWWKLSVKERKSHFHTIKIHLLSPFLFSRNANDDFCRYWAVDAGIISKKPKSHKDPLVDDDYKNIDLIEEAVTVLQENLSKFDGSKHLDSVIHAMEKTRNERIFDNFQIPSVNAALRQLHREEWFSFFRSEMVESKKETATTKDTAILIAAMKVYSYIRELHTGGQPLVMYKTLADLSDAKSKDEKERGNKFFSEHLYDKAIHVYSNILRAKPYNHIVYSNRAQCHLKNGDYRLALADARRTIALEPSWEKGQYRFAQSLENLGKIDDAMRALRRALRICPSQDLEKYRIRITRQIELREQRERIKRILESDEPPDLVTPSSADQSSDDDYDDSYDGMSDEYADFSSTEGVPELFSDDSDDDYNGIEKPVISTKKAQNFAESTKKDKSKAMSQAKKKGKQPEKKSMQGEKEIISTAVDSKHMDLYNEMKKATDYFLAENFECAKTSYSYVRDLIKCRRDFSLREEDEVVLIYAHGMASCECGSPSDLMSAKVQFEFILENFSNIHFPLASYGCGKVLQKQFKFSAMHSVFIKSLEMIAKFGIKIQKWPGSDVIIEETRDGKLKQIITDLLATIDATQNPDAVCRFEDCEQDRKYMFIDDIDFKGFMKLQCSESCKIEYHPSCWQKVKKKLDFKDHSPLKDFLNRTCLTPDCEGIFYYIHYTFLNRDGALKEKEHKIDLPKKSTTGTSKIDKSKRMKACSYKKREKKLNLERERLKAQQIKEIDDDITSILNELDEEEAMKKALADKENLSNGPNPLYIGPEPKVPTWLEAVDPITVAAKNGSGEFLLNKDREESGSEWQQKKKKQRKKKSKKKSPQTKEILSSRNSKQRKPQSFSETQAPQSLTNFLGPEDTDRLREVFQEASHLERSNSICSSVASNSTDASAIPTESIFGSGTQEDSNPEYMEKNVKEHLHSIFADLLVSKGRMDVNTDEDIRDLMNILDTYSSKIIRDSGGLRDFLSLSSKFAFDPDERDVVYLAEEAEIYLFSKREAARKKMDGFDSYSELSNGNGNDTDGDNGRMSEASLGSFKEDLDKEIADSDPVSSTNVNKKNSEAKVNGESIITDSLNDLKSLNGSKKSSTKIVHSIRDSGNVFQNLADKALNDKGMGVMTDQRPPNPYITPLQQKMTRPLFNPCERIAEKYKNVKKNSKSNHSGESQQQSETIKQSEIDPIVNDSKFKDPDSKKTREVAIMTDFEFKQYKELYENEIKEKRQLYEKYVEAMDNAEQLKNKLKVEKDVAGRKEKEMKAKLEEMRKKVMKEQQSRESAQKKWQQEKEKMNDTIRSLGQKIASYDEEGYKAKLKDQEKEMNRIIEKIGEMRLQQEKARTDNEDIISKLSNCVTEQSKRAQKGELAFVELKKAEVASGFKKVLEHGRMTMYSLEQNPFIDQSVNRGDLMKGWGIYIDVVSSNMRKCMFEFDERIQKLKNGVPLDDMPPVQVPTNPPPPPQPKMMPCPPNMQNAAKMPGQVPQGLQMMPGGPPPRMMPTPNMIPPQMMNGAKPPSLLSPPGGRPSQTTAEEKPSVNDSGQSASVPNGATGLVPVNGAHSADIEASVAKLRTPPDEEVAAKKIDAQKVTDAKDEADNKANDKSAGKSSSFEKIMAKLGSQFPSYSRDDLIKFLKDFREQRSNTLSGLRVEDIISMVSKMIKESDSYKKRVSEAMKSHQEAVRLKAGGDPFGFEEPCIICHDDMPHVKGTTRLQCHHVFHSECIRRWLKEQRTCPTCRNHALLPDEFPSLN